MTSGRLVVARPAAVGVEARPRAGRAHVGGLRGATAHTALLLARDGLQARIVGVDRAVAVVVDAVANFVAAADELARVHVRARRGARVGRGRGAPSRDTKKTRPLNCPLVGLLDENALTPTRTASVTSG